MKRYYNSANNISPIGHDYTRPARYFWTGSTDPHREILSDISSRGRILYSPIGELFRNELQRTVANFPVVIDSYAIMPTHAHVCFRVTAPLPFPVTRIISGWKYFSTRSARMQYPQLGIESLWDRRHRLFVAVSDSVYRRCCRYTANNGICWALAHDPGTHFALQPLRHAALDPRFVWEGFGNIELLNHPFIFCVHVHHDATARDIQEQTEAALHAVANGFVLAGGFVSAAERGIGNAVVKAFPEAAVIRFSPWSLRKFKPSGPLLPFYAGMRWLEVTSAVDNFSGEIERSVCRRHNLAAEALATGAVGIGHGNEALTPQQAAELSRAMANTVLKPMPEYKADFLPPGGTTRRLPEEGGRGERRGI